MKTLAVAFVKAMALVAFGAAFGWFACGVTHQPTARPVDTCALERLAELDRQAWVLGCSYQQIEGVLANRVSAGLPPARASR